MKTNNVIVFGIVGFVLVGLMQSNVVVEAARCPRKCRKLIGNGNCDQDCNIEECDFDGGDCATYEYEYYYEAVPTPAPTPKRGKITARPTNKPVSTPFKQPTNKPVSNPVTAPTLSPNVDQGKYNIEIIFPKLSSTSQSVQDAFAAAKAKWESVIVGDIPSTYLYSKGKTCFNEKSTALSADKVVDDLLIFADIAPIDGTNGILGSSGPCWVTRSGSDTFARVGLMQFDSADLTNMDRQGILKGVILHEMGHVIGVGTIWDDYNLVKKVNSKTAWFTGPQAAIGLKEVGGSGQPAVETDGGGGTAYGHFDEETYDNELMTGYVSKTMPMSKLTIRSLADLGLVVDVSQADPYSVPRSGALRGAREPGVHIGDDIIRQKPQVDEATPYPKKN